MSPDASAAERRAPHLVLVGLPGCGKSVVGRRAAAISGRVFLDFDAEIEHRVGMPVSRIFAERGEPAFRALERDLTQELREGAGMILVPGGGWITNPDVVQLLRPPGRLVYLAVSPETALQRMGAGRARRPLLGGPDPLEALRRLYQERRLLYEGADYQLDSETLGMKRVTEMVVAFARELR